MSAHIFTITRHDREHLAHEREVDCIDLPGTEPGSGAILLCRLCGKVFVFEGIRGIRLAQVEDILTLDHSAQLILATAHSVIKKTIMKFEEGKANAKTK